MVEAEVIGASAFASISDGDAIDVLCKVSQTPGRALFGMLKQMLENDPASSCVREHPETFAGYPSTGLRFSYFKVQFRMYLAQVPWEEHDEETFHSLNGCLLA